MSYETEEAVRRELADVIERLEVAKVTIQAVIAALRLDGRALRKQREEAPDAPGLVGWEYLASIAGQLKRGLDATTPAPQPDPGVVGTPETAEPSEEILETIEGELEPMIAEGEPTRVDIQHAAVRIARALGLVDDGQPRSWSLPAEPGPEVTAVRDSEGFIWRRREEWWTPSFPPMEDLTWAWLVATNGPLTDATHEEPTDG